MATARPSISARVGAVEARSTIAVSAVIADRPTADPDDRGEQRQAGDEQRPKVITRTTEATPTPIISVLELSLRRADHAAGELDLQARVARGPGNALERVLGGVLEFLDRDRELQVGVGDRLVARDLDAGGELLAGRDRLRHLLRAVDRRLDDLPVARLRELVALRSGEHDPRRRAAGARELLLQQVERALRLGPRHVEGVVLGCLTACEVAKTATSSATQKPSTNQRRRTAQWPKRYRYDDMSPSLTRSSRRSVRP